MMVTFVSQCEKKALPRTRLVLDAFADRIGDNTWQTVITQEGLNAVRKLLRKTASKNTAIACHWIRSRSRSDLVWVIGNKQKFNVRGIVPVNSTTTNHTYRDDTTDWHYLPLIQSLTSIAALLHDWGKANARFQEKLDKSYRGKAGDALRHEWVSCLLLKALITQTDAATDEGWLKLLASGEIDEAKLLQTDMKQIQPLSALPPIAQLVAWLILTHHRMPLPRIPSHTLLDKWGGYDAESIEKVLAYIDEQWGYQNDDAASTLENCLRFPEGLLTQSKLWLRPLKRWATKLREQTPLFEKIMHDGSQRLLLHHARLCLMLGDHYYSSLTLEESGQWHSTTTMIANTQKDGSPKQALDQHLVGVYQQAKRNAQKLPQLENALPVTDNIGPLKKKSPSAFAWQDKAAKKVRDWANTHNQQKYGFFAVNMASTGCGKTFANAKVMLALSENQESLRYILALGLRTLTLQTGDEYRERIFQHSDGSDLGVLIGSKAIAELHDQQKREVEPTGEKGSESQESLLAEQDEIIYDLDIPEDGMATLLPNAKARKFLYAPVLACTIDHIMAATETTRGGRYILPSLRLMSSDLVIDEVDDFTGADTIAIGRLIHLAGMLGRRVMISSATIPPALAEGYFHCYREGWSLFAKTRNACATVGCAWIDEFNTRIADIQANDAAQANPIYAQHHQRFTSKRIDKLSQQPVKRRATIIDCEQAIAAKSEDRQSKQTRYFDIIAKAALDKHRQHNQRDKETNLDVSFGVIRVANISPCVALTQYLLEYPIDDNIHLRIMPYHSQQVLLLRHEQEKHLDAVLKRKEKSGEKPEAFSNTIIRQHLDQLASQKTPPEHVVFILVATPVEEVGRDHDFDWAIIEPSSYRSIIQLAGRVRRHRSGPVDTPNIGILQYNWKTVERGEKAYARYFSRPGYEYNGKIIVNGKERFASCAVHDLKQLINQTVVAKRLDATPRITLDLSLGFGLANLEHAVTAHWLTRYDAKGPESLEGYLNQHWYLTALPQALNRFRQSEPSVALYRFPDDKPCFYQLDEQGHITRYEHDGEPVNMAESYNIKPSHLTEKQKQRLWFQRNYEQSLSSQAEIRGYSLRKATVRYGEILLRRPLVDASERDYLYDDQMGLFRKERR